jgi:hypothetical protein
MVVGSVVIVPVVVIGLILAFLEMIFVHQDEAGMGWLKHGLHAIPTMFVFLFISMNVSLVENWLGIANNMWIVVSIRVVIGLIAVVKMKAAAAVAGRVGENWPHVLIIGALIIAAPYAWEAFACGLPFVKTLPMNGCPIPGK